MIDRIRKPAVLDGAVVRVNRIALRQQADSLRGYLTAYEAIVGYHARLIRRDGVDPDPISGNGVASDPLVS